MPYNAAYKSKHNLKHENHIILIMITNGKKLHYLAGKKLSALHRGIASNYVRGFYCQNCFYSFSTENKLKKRENVCKNHDYCYIEMPKEDKKKY